MLGGRATPAPTAALSQVKGYMVGENTGYLVALDSEDRVLGFRRWEYVDGFYFTRELYVVPEMRKNLTGDQPQPKGEREALGFT